jgi:hypothetical protein
VDDDDERVAGFDAGARGRGREFLHALVRVKLARVGGLDFERVCDDPVGEFVVQVGEPVFRGAHDDGEVFGAVAVEVADDRARVALVEGDRALVRARERGLNLGASRRRGRRRRVRPRLRLHAGRDERRLRFLIRRGLRRRLRVRGRLFARGLTVGARGEREGERERNAKKRGA